MSVTVADVLQLPVLAHAEVVAGQSGLGNPVRWVHVTELPDISRLLRGGELLLTIGMPLVSSPAGQEQFVQELASRGVAGLVIELGRIHRQVPEPVRAAADRAGLPVIALHREVAFVQVTEEVHTLLINRHYADLRRAEEAAGMLNRLALEQAGIPAVLAALQRVVRNPVLLLPLDPAEPMQAVPPGLLAPGRLHPPTPAGSRAGAGRCRWRGRELSTWQQPVLLAGRYWGDLCIIESRSRLGEVERLIVDRAAVTVAYELLREASLREQRQRRHAELCVELLAGAPGGVEAALDQAEALGVRLRGQVLAAVALHLPVMPAPPVSPGQPAPPAPPAPEVLALLHRHRIAALSRTRGEMVQLLAAGGSEAILVQGLRRAAGTWEEAASGPAVGIGRPVRHPADLPLSLRQAEWTLRLRRAQPKAFPEPFFAAAGSYRFLLAADPRDQQWLIQSVLGPLLAPGADPEGQLLQTLRLLTDHAEPQMAQIARRLGISRQGLYQRRERIQNLLGLDLGQPEGVLSAALALRLFDIQQL